MQKINNEFYNSYGDRWYTAFDDPVALLRAESKLKTPWIQEKITEHFGAGKKLAILDVGCGAGFLSNALAMNTDFKVTGVDLSQESLDVAGRYDRSSRVSYLKADAYSLPFADQSFDVVTAMDFLEHVDDPARVILEISRVLRPGGVFFFHTFNRNLLAFVVIIKLVEYFVKNTPRNMHVLKLFIKPRELTQYCQSAGLSTLGMRGIKPVFSSIPVSHLFSRIVPESLRFEFTHSLLLSYIGYAKKDGLAPDIIGFF